MNILEGIKEILKELLDIEDQEITPETYLVRELRAESIDFLELAVALNSKFKIEVNDGEIFLSKLRIYVSEAKENGKDRVQYLVERLPFLTKSRVEEIIADLDEGPTLKVKDLVSYVGWQREKG
jgi:acyl carrier protein